MVRRKQKLLLIACLFVIFAFERLTWAILRGIYGHSNFFQTLGGNETTDIPMFFVGLGIITLLSTLFVAFFFAKFFYTSALSAPVMGGKRKVTMLLTAIGGAMAASFLLFYSYGVVQAYTGSIRFTSAPNVFVLLLQPIPLFCMWLADSLHEFSNVLPQVAEWNLYNFINDSLQFYVFSAVLFATFFGVCRIKAKPNGTAQH